LKSFLPQTLILLRTLLSTHRDDYSI